MTLAPCCSAVVARYREIMNGDERDGAALFCSSCGSRIRVAVDDLGPGERFIQARTESPTP